MAALIRLSKETYSWVAEQAALVTGGYYFSPFVLAEAFPVFSMTPGSWEAGSFYATGLWHFQIKTFDENHPSPVGYMRARIFGPRPLDWEFCGIFESWILASGIENAVNIADENDNDETKEARLLVSPSYRLTSLWLSAKDYNNDLFIIAYAPQSTREIFGNNLVLNRGQFREFVSSLPIIQGRVNDNDQQDFQ